jgi:surface polysaccharide O-acyltransferase-like enzyme
MARYGRRLVLLMRIVGSVTLLATVAVFMPRSWMAACHAWLGMGAFPDAPVVEYLARSLSAFYAVLGGLLWVASADPRRHSRVITYLALTGVVFAALIFLIDLQIGLPAFWTWCEGPIVLILGVAILWLQRKARPEYF